ncbi:hypothetical protein FF1_039204 [Malus domestica]
MPPMTATVDSGPNWSTTMQFDSLWRILEAQMIKLYKTSTGNTSENWVGSRFLDAQSKTDMRNLDPTQFSDVFPVEVLYSLIICASKILHKESNCIVVDQLGPESTVDVIGGIHGQLHNLLLLLKDARCPSENRLFVFNGDFIGVEGTVGKCLPLTSIIGKYVYTAHGGLFHSTMAYLKKSKGKKKRKISFNPELSITLSLGTFEELNKAQRMVLDPPSEGSNLIPGDVLWSDPSMDPGLSLNQLRGAGLLWGPDCTEEFLKKFQLKFLTTVALAQ